MRIIFDRIIAKLEDLSEHDVCGDIVNLEDAIRAVYEVKNYYKDKFVSVRCLEQVKWERDIAIGQLKELGLGLGEEIDKDDFIKVTRCKDCKHHRCSERNLWCNVFDIIMPEDGYCCCGE